MADNLSALIKDAFTIYSESYIKIGEIGSKVVDLKGKPGQPKKIKQLIEAVALYSVISPSINLNSGGTAIEGVTGDIETINNLLLKLKRAVKLYDLPVMPTPLTEFVFNLGNGGADPDLTYITVITEAGLPQSRRLAQGSGVAIVDNGAQGTIEISSTAGLSSLQVVYSASPITLNMAGLIERLFYGAGSINGLRTWALSNSSNAKRLQAIFTITGLTPGASTHDQTLWANTVISTVAGIVPSAGVFRPMQDGDYEIEATTYDGTNWKVKITML